MVVGTDSHDADAFRGVDLPVWDRRRAVHLHALLNGHQRVADANFADRLRRWVVPAPFLVFFYTLFVKGLILDGWPGWYYVLQRTLAETVLSLRLMEARLGVRGEPEL